MHHAQNRLHEDIIAHGKNKFKHLNSDYSDYYSQNSSIHRKYAIKNAIRHEHIFHKGVAVWNSCHHKKIESGDKNY